MADINPKEIIEKIRPRAVELLRDKDRLNQLIKDANHKNVAGQIDKFVDNIKLLIGLITDFKSGDYRDVPWGSLIMIVCAIVYFVSPFDLVPDLIPAGYLDDAIVVAFVINQIDSDLQKYKEWKLAKQLV
jgi:uncharacterized membrane protein YkvA (DUF1232 family)